MSFRCYWEACIVSHLPRFGWSAIQTSHFTPSWIPSDYLTSELELIICHSERTTSIQRWILDVVGSKKVMQDHHKPPHNKRLGKERQKKKSVGAGTPVECSFATSALVKRISCRRSAVDIKHLPMFWVINVSFGSEVAHSGFVDEDVAARLKKKSRQANLTQQTRPDTNMEGLRSLSRRLQLNLRRQRLEEEGKSTRREDLPSVLRGGQARYVIHNSGARAEHFTSTDNRFPESRMRIPREAKDQTSIAPDPIFIKSEFTPSAPISWITLTAFLVSAEESPYENPAYEPNLVRVATASESWFSM